MTQRGQGPPAGHGHTASEHGRSLPQVCVTLGFVLSPLRQTEERGGQQQTWEAWPLRCRSEGLKVSGSRRELTTATTHGAFSLALGPLGTVLEEGTKQFSPNRVGNTQYGRAEGRGPLRARGPQLAWGSLVLEEVT